MGNAASKSTAYGKLADELPPVKKMGHDENWNYTDLGPRVFTNDQDREQFIFAVIAVSTSNGQLDLTGADYKLFYSRRERSRPTPASSKGNGEDDGTDVIASIAALREGRIIAKIEPAAGGPDQREAFLALKRDVEVKLGQILQSVPSAVSSSAARPSVPTDMPPSYQSSAVGIEARREKA